MTNRLIGLLLLGIGAFLAYSCIYSPLEKARAGDTNLSLSMTGTVIVPLLLLYGLAYLMLGEQATEIFGERKNPKPAAYVAAIVLVGIGFGVYFWLRSTLEGYGYTFK